MAHIQNRFLKVAVYKQPQGMKEYLIRLIPENENEIKERLKNNANVNIDDALYLMNQALFFRAILIEGAVIKSSKKNDGFCYLIVFQNDKLFITHITSKSELEKKSNLYLISQIKIIFDSFSKPLEIDPDLDQVNFECEVPLLKNEANTVPNTADNLLPTEIPGPLNFFEYNTEMEFTIDSQNGCSFKTRQDLL